MKRYTFLGLILCVSAALFITQNEQSLTNTISAKEQVAMKNNLPSERSRDGQIKLLTTPERLIGKGVKIRNPSSKSEARRDVSSPLDSFKKEKIEFFAESYFLVEGAYASLDPLPGVRAITRVAGFFVYPDRIENSVQIVFDPVKKQYGVFTGEIIVNGAYGKSIELIEKSGYEITYQNPQIGHVVFIVTDLQDLSSLSELKAVRGLSMLPDVKFSRLKSM